MADIRALPGGPDGDDCSKTIDHGGGFMFGRAAALSIEKPGDVCGPYKLLKVIGEGGFGVVRLAEPTPETEAGAGRR